MTSSIPDVAIIGVQKCGTTSLARIFEMTPGLSVCEPKEPNFFNSEPAGRFYCESLRWTDDPTAYRRFFDRAGPGKTVDCSIQLAFDELGLARLRRFNPDVRVVVLVREPRRRAVSAALHLFRLMVMHGDPRALEAIEDPESLFAEFDRLEGYSRYRTMLDHISGVYDPAQVLLLVMEEAFGNPRGACDALGRHLGLPLSYVPRHWDRAWNRGSTPGWGPAERGLRRVSALVGAVAGERAVGAIRRTGIPDHIRRRFHSPRIADQIAKRARQHVEAYDFSRDIAAVETWLGRTVEDWR